MNQIKKPRGTLDILPEQTAAWQYIESVIRKKCLEYGFGEIRFPTFEATELFSRGVGDTTDVVQKEMYTFKDRDDRSLSLRPEGTACVVRSMLENGLYAGAMPLKLYYLTNFFRYEKPQAGRSREFFQFGTELFGSESPAADATVISLAYSVFKELGLNNVKLHINSVGCPNCRPVYREALVDYLGGYTDKLCPTCIERLGKNPLRVLDCKSPICSEIASGAPKTTDHLCEDCQNHLKALTDILDSTGVPYVIDSGIVRGLDYYTGTVFEFIDERIGAQSTVCGGGRYDGLVAQLGGPQMSGVGFGMGITRLVACLEQEDLLKSVDTAPDIYLAPADKDGYTKVFALCEELRGMGIKAETDLCSRSIKAQMKYADKTGARYVAVIGGNELEQGVVTVKNMQNGGRAEVNLSAADIANAIKNDE